MTTLAVPNEKAPLRPPRERGTLDIHDRVVTKISGRAAAEVDGVEVRSAGGLRGLLGRVDDVDADVDGTAVTVTVTVTIDYPLPVFDTAAQVRRQVATRLNQLAGMGHVEVSVEIAELVIHGGHVAHRVV